MSSHFKVLSQIHILHLRNKRPVGFVSHREAAARAVLKLAGTFGDPLKRALSISQRSAPRAFAQMNEHARGK